MEQQNRNETPPVKLTPAQIEQIADENAERIRHATIKSAFSSRTQGFWAGSGLGLFFGAVIGAVVAVSPIAIVGTAAVMAMLPEVIGAFALAGMASGGALMAAVNAPAGAVMGKAKIEERRKLLSNPAQALAENDQYRNAVQEKETFWNRTVPFNKGSKAVFSVRNALIFAGFALAAGAALFMLGGAPLLAGISGAFGSALPHVAAVIGVKAGATVAAATVAAHAATCMGLTTCGMFGALFGIDGPTIAANATQYVADIFGGKKLNFGKGNAVQAEKAYIPPAPVQITITPEEAAILSAKLDNASERNFTQTLNTQQMQPSGLQA